MSARTPLAQYASARMNDIDKMCIRFVQIARIIRGRIEEYGRIESGDASDFTFFGRQMVGNQTGDVRTNTVANEMHPIGWYATRMVRNVFD